ncbi:Transcriptional regulator, LysR family protein [Minicystis rosea]|nr:Transcriptional regulator, LysR family protein [Minicystis rosea]
MELRHLRYFLAVADTLHFGRASRRLHASQPTVSQQIKQLEEELGAPLFERTSHGVRLSQAGEVFRTHATRALEDVHAGERALRALAGLELGALRIGHIPSLAAGLVVPAAAAVLQNHPGIKISASEGTTRRVERRLVEGKLDVGVGFAPSRAPEVEAEPIFEGRLALVVPRGHALAARPRVGLADLADEPFSLLAPGMRVRAMVDAFFGSARFSPRVVFEADAVATVLAMVRAGVGLTVLPEPRFLESERLAVVALAPAPQSHFAALLWRKGAPRSPPALAFAEAVRRVGRGV